MTLIERGIAAGPTSRRRAPAPFGSILEKIRKPH
jgi:hypothetical protein